MHWSIRHASCRQVRDIANAFIWASGLGWKAFDVSYNCMLHVGAVCSLVTRVYRGSGGRVRGRKAACRFGAAAADK